MSRVQLALNVADLAASIRFYETLFATKPHKERPGYANFEVTNPPLKLVLIEVPENERGSGPAGALNHLGVEVDDTAEVAAQTRRLTEAGLNPFEQEQTNCCHAVQDKAWIADPAGAPWEVYTITDDNPDSGDNATVQESSCCIPAASDSALVMETVSDEGGCGCGGSDKSSNHEVSIDEATVPKDGGCCQADSSEETASSGGDESAAEQSSTSAELAPCCSGADSR